ncbi:nickel/cobalt transporter [Ruegeria sp.]|uniref:nickel/cobalt transporter n=1 Tax=Ruegeria sp. TaxID=1879320 RepID=UPI003B5C823D
MSLVLLTVFLLIAGNDLWQDFARWAGTQQRAFQNEMASAIRSIQAGNPGAWVALLAATGLYGFVHALGPGHGKFVIGGIGLGTKVSARRLATVALTSSLAQSIWAILLVYGGFFLFQASAAQFTDVADTYLAPASYLAVTAVGLILVVRSVKALRARTLRPMHTHHTHASCGCRGHGPSAHDVTRMTSLRGALLVVASIAIRSCTGALFLLVIAWQTGIATAGAIAVIVMGVGTATTTILIAISSVFARGVVGLSSRNLGGMTLAAPSLQLLSGLVVFGFALALLGTDTF